MVNFTIPGFTADLNLIGNNKFSTSYFMKQNKVNSSVIPALRRFCDQCHECDVCYNCDNYGIPPDECWKYYCSPCYECQSDCIPVPI
jgi:hypothetical protein